MNQEKEEEGEYPEAYYPIPKGVIKDEETSGENNVEQQMMYPLAYPPLPRGLVKEEAPFGDAREECNEQAQQLMASSPTSNGTINKELERSMEEHNIFNLDEGQQVSLEPLIAYLPLPRGAIKEEPLEENEGDEQPQQVIIAYPPIARGRVKEELQSNVNNQNDCNLEEHQVASDELDVDEHQLDLEPLIVYPSLPRGVIKDEPPEEKEGDEQPKQVIIAYPPIARGRIKEELLSEGGNNQNLIDESTSAPIITATTDVSTEDRGNGTKRRKSQRKKKITTASTAVISQSGPTESDDQSAKTMSTSTISSRTHRSLHQLERGSTSMVSAYNDGEKDGHSTEDRGHGAQRPKSKKRKIITASTAETPSSTGSGDQSAKTMSTISSRTRRISMHQLKRGKTPMTRDADEEKDDHSTAESDDLGGQKSDKTVPTISSRTRSHHLKPSSATVARAAIGETSKKRKVNKDKTKEKQQQDTKDDKRNKTSENSSLIDGGSSSFSDKTSERPSDSHNKYPCKECGRGFQRKCSLRLHFLSAHTGTGHETPPLNRFKCDQCMKTYKNKNSLVQHLMNECRVDPAFPCPQCDYKATKKSSLRKHLMSIHKVDRSQLDTVSPAAALYVRPVLPFKCDTCENTFKSKDSLYFHKKRVCGVAKSFTCVKCDYRTARKSNLRKHIMNVHGVEQSQLASFGAGKVVRPQMPFKCDKCELSYNEKRYLKRHMASHGIPSFPCNQCGYRATEKARIKRHIDTVHGASSSSLQA